MAPLPVSLQPMDCMNARNGAGLLVTIGMEVPLNRAKLGALPILAFGLAAHARADCLADASTFAVGLCGELEKSGNSIVVSGNIQGKAELSKLIKNFSDVSGRGKAVGRVSSYVGPARRELLKDRFDTRACRQNMALKAI